MAPLDPKSVRGKLRGFLTRQRIGVPTRKLQLADAAMPGQREPLWQQVHDLMRKVRPTEPRYAVLALTPTRTYVDSLLVGGERREDVRRLDSFLWAVPVEQFPEGVDDPGLEAMLGPEPTAALGIVDVVLESRLAGFAPQGAEEEAPPEEPAEGDAPADAPSADDALPEGSPGRVIRDRGLGFILSSCVWLLDHRLKQCGADAAKRAARRMFVAMDFLTNHELLATGMCFETPGALLEQTQRDLGVRFEGFDAVAWRRDVDEDLEQVLELFTRVGDVKAKALLGKVGAVVEQHISARFDGEQDAPYAYEWTNNVFGVERLLDLRDALVLVFDYFERAMTVLLPPEADGRPTTGLVHDDDLQQFATGSLLLGKGDGHDILNCEPNGGLFFSFCEFFLMCSGLGDRAAERARRWARVALEAEALFVEHYKPPGPYPVRLTNFTFREGPYEDRGQEGFRDKVTGELPPEDADHDALRGAHHAFMQRASEPRDPAPGIA